MTVTKDPLLVNTSEAAHLLGLSKSHLEKLRHFRRDGPPVAYFGRTVRYPVAGLRAWSDAHQGGGANAQR